MDESYMWTTMKKRFPFSMGTTSYIFPADILPNVKALAGIVDDIELVLFESDISNIPGQSEIHELAELAEKHDISYTVHFPLDMTLGDADESNRKKSLDTCFRIIDQMEPVHPFAYLVHCSRSDESPAIWNRMNIDDWANALGRSLKELSSSSVEPCRFCVETLNYPFEFVDTLVSDCNMSICLDIGHILLNGYSLVEYLSRYLGRTRVIHLHGIKKGKDHQSIEHMSNENLMLLFAHLSHSSLNERVVTLEVFNEMDLKASMDIVEAYIS